MSERPWLTVVIPTYQGERFLARALASVEAQREPGPIELLAVDDGSSDGTLGILAAFAARLPLRVLRPGRSGRWARSTNLGLGEARGVYACVLHQDDTWEPGRLAALRRLVSRHPDGVLFVHPSRYIDGDDRELGRLHPPLPGGEVTGLIRPRLLVQNFLAVAAVLFRRDAALEVGGMDEALWYTADWDLWLKLAGAGTCHHLPEVLASFRLHRGAQTMLGSREPEDFRAQLERVLARHRGGMSSETLRAARFSVETNVALAALAHGRRADLLGLAARFFELGPSGWFRYFRDSRLVERVSARRSLLRGEPGGDPAPDLDPARAA